MKKIILLIFITFSISGCNDKNIILQKEKIEILSNNDFSIPTKNGSIPVFVLSNDDLIICTNVDYLYYIYSTFYNKEYRKFYDFLYNSLNQEIIIPKEDFSKIPVDIFKQNIRVKKDYEKNNFNAFLDKYCIKDGKYLLLNKKMINKKDERLTTMYYLFLNGLYIITDDYGGNFYVKRWSEIVKK